MVNAILASLSFLVAAVAAAPAAVERRSNYPPGYVVSTDCRTEGPVRVCALNKSYGIPRLTVTYSNTGYLWAQGSPLSAWVSINSQSDTFGNFTADSIYGQPTPTSATYVIGALRNVQMCYHGTTAENSTYTPAYSSGYPRCPVNEIYPLIDGPVDGGYVGWYYDPAPEKEKKLTDQTGTWNIQVAVVNGKGNWDSKYGQNYRFTL
ncbi:hypothetical protein HDU96_001596 [Phlyctochytrium bullatum]|nr:hypothetical protein HDU96_001596 [Phlyctochytrium bullatum]